ncbi:motilin-like [Alosa alosa]|uniref:motilin-like n=1 Tax=Alosa sapidissima TaxID=34773 RepID=UPI001C09C0B6|nr:motilin-like [Alosa sapidissima]XP_048115275.1 motilin-like [Alosa alosa]
MRGAVLGCLLLVCAVLLLVEQAEGHITFFSPQQMEEMRLKGKGPRSEDKTPEETSVQPLPLEEDPQVHGTEVEISIKLTADQLEHVTKEIVKDALEIGAA